MLVTGIWICIRINRILKYRLSQLAHGRTVCHPKGEAGETDSEAETRREHKLAGLLCLSLCCLLDLSVHPNFTACSEPLHCTCGRLVQDAVKAVTSGPRCHMPHGCDQYGLVS